MKNEDEQNVEENNGEVTNKLSITSNSLVNRMKNNNTKKTRTTKINAEGKKGDTHPLQDSNSGRKLPTSSYFCTLSSLRSPRPKRYLARCLLLLLLLLLCSSCYSSFSVCFPSFLAVGHLPRGTTGTTHAVVLHDIVLHNNDTPARSGCDWPGPRDDLHGWSDFRPGVSGN